MITFQSKQNRELLMDLDDEGISFHYTAAKQVYHVGQSWASIHALLAKLYSMQEYSARNQSLSVWIQDQELYLVFHAPERKQAEVCRFSPAETGRIMDFLGKAPNLN